MKKQPVISILGRPNVGKSTLFNRLTKTKKAIIDDTPGVTRDVLKQEFLLGENEIPVILQDTGGLTDEGDILNPLVQKKSVEALKTSDLILFMVEAKNVLPIEEEFINMIRKSGKPAIIIMNKSDSLDKDIYIHDFHQYGLGEPLPISAAHNRNIDELLEMIEAKLQLNVDDEDEDASNEETETSEAKEQDESLIKIAIVGKPNVGKSSLLNKITQKERSIVSNIPGTTRDIIDESITYKNHEFRFLDTAGIRKKSKVSEDIEYYSVNRSIKAINDADINVVTKKIREYVLKYGCTICTYDTFKINNADMREARQDLSLVRDSRELDKLAKKYNIIMLYSIQLSEAMKGKLWLDSSTLSNSKQIKEQLEGLCLLRNVYDDELDKSSKYYLRPFRRVKHSDSWDEEEYECDRTRVWKILFLEKTRTGANTSDTNIAYLLSFDGDHAVFRETCLCRPRHGQII